MSISFTNIFEIIYGDIMSIVERIKMRCKELNTSMNALEKELGFGNGSIRLWDTKEPGAKKALAVAEKLEKSLDWLLTGKEAGDLTPEEQLLVDLYRSSSGTGQEIILDNARSMQARFPADPPEPDEHPAGVSVSETG